jgi:hypothetical protein
MKRPALFSLLALALLISVAPAHAAVTPAAKLNGPITDNYKARFNADPNVVERRTWLSMRSVTIGTAVFTPEVGQAQFTQSLRVRDSRNRVRVATMAMSGANGQILTWRNDAAVGASQNRFGPLIQLRAKATPATGNVRVVISFRTLAGALVAAKIATYRYDQALANAPARSLEWNGPGGRWFVGSVATRTNVEARI